MLYKNGRGVSGAKLLCWNKNGRGGQDGQAVRWPRRESRLGPSSDAVLRYNIHHFEHRWPFTTTIKDVGLFISAQPGGEPYPVYTRRKSTCGDERRAIKIRLTDAFKYVGNEP